MKLKNNNSFDAILLVIVKAFTILVGIITTMILSKELSLVVYGTYATGNLIYTTVVSFTVLGFVDATNVFYNKTDDDAVSRKYLNTIFGIQVIIGILTALLIIGGTNLFVIFFKNPELSGILIYIAFRPMIANLTTSLQILQLSIGKAKAIALRNAIMSVFKIAVVSVTAYVTHDILTIFIAYLIADIAMLAMFAANFFRVKYVINPLKIDTSLIKEILVFSVPMGIYVMTNTLSRQIDRFVIGFFENTENLAVYTNCATALPFDIVSAAFLSIMIPIMTRYIARKEYGKARHLFSCYLKVGYLSTFVFTVAAIICSREMILFLYGSKYLGMTGVYSGQPIFILYTVVDMLKFANVSLVLSAKGETKTLMYVSLGSLVANLVLNIAFYYIFGFAGPAIATVIVTAAMTLILCRRSASILHTKLYKMLDYRDIGLFVSELAIAAGLAIPLLLWLRTLSLPYYVRLVIVAGAFIGSLLLVNLKNIRGLFKEINSMKLQQDEG